MAGERRLRVIDEWPVTVFVSQTRKSHQSTNKAKQWDESHRLTYSLFALELSLAEFFVIRLGFMSQSNILECQ